MSDLSKLFTEGAYDVTLHPQGKGDYGHAVTCKLETMESEENGLRTKKKVTVTAFSKSSIAAAETAALKKALKLLNLA